MSSSSSSGRISPVEKEVIDRKKSIINRALRRAKRKQKSIETQQAILNNPPIELTTLPDIFGTKKKQKKTNHIHIDFNVDDDELIQLMVKQEEDPVIKQEHSQEYDRLCKCPMHHNPVCNNCGKMNPLNYSNDIMLPESSSSSIIHSNLYQLRSITDIIQDHPHLALSSSNLPQCERVQSIRIPQEHEEEEKYPIDHEESKEDVRLPMVTKMSTAELTRAQLRSQSIHPSIQFHHQYNQTHPDNNPYEYPEFRQLLDYYHGMYPKYHNHIQHLHTQGEATTDMLQDDLKRPRVNLEIRTASYETILLQESGSWENTTLNKLIYYPKCKSNTLCVGVTRINQIKNLQRPMVLMGAVPESIYYKEILESQKGEDYDLMYPCVLCYRYITHRCILLHRQAICDGHPTPFQKPSHTVSYHIDTYPIQSYYNLMDMKEGYKSEHMLLQSPSKDLCFQPIVKDDLMDLYSIQDPDTGRRQIIQTKLVWTPPNSQLHASLGEPVSHFLNRNKQEVSKDLYHQMLRNGDMVQKMILCLLQEYDLTLYPITFQDVQNYMKNPPINPRDSRGLRDPHHSELISYSFTLLHDAYLLSKHCNLTQPTFTWQECSWTHVKCDVLLPSILCQHAHKMSWFAPLTDVNSILGRLFTKIAVNSRCQGRVMSKIISNALIQRSIRKRKRSRKHKNDDIEYDDQYLSLMKHIILCGLLGNYVGDSNIRPCEFKVRYSLYYLFSTSRFDSWILRLIKNATSILTFCIRRYVVYLVEHNPSMYEILYKQMHFEEYKKITHEAMICIIHLFTMMILGDSSLHTEYEGIQELIMEYNLCMKTVPLDRSSNLKMWQCGHKECLKQPMCLYTPISIKNKKLQDLYENKEEHSKEWDDHQPHRFHILLQDKYLESYERRFRKLGQSRPHVDIALLLRPLVKYYPLVNPNHFKEGDGVHVTPIYRQCELKEQDNEDINNENDNIMQKDKNIIKEIKFSDLNNISIEDDIEENEQHDEDNQDEEWDLGDLDDPKDQEDDQEDILEKEQNNYLFPKDQAHFYINSHQKRALEDLVSSCGPVGYGLCIQRILDGFIYFNISQPHVEWLKKLFTHYLNNTKTTQSVKICLSMLRLVDPHAYNVLQIASMLLDQSRRRFRLTDLPFHIMMAQLDTLQHMYSSGNQGDQKILLDSSISFCFCPICFKTYSHVSDYNSVYKHQYTLGKRDASVDYLAIDSIYCTSNKENARGKCGENQLVRLPLIGKLLWLRSKCILLCPQNKCGGFMAFDTKEFYYSAYTEKGPSCTNCTRRLINQSIIYTMEGLQQSYNLYSHNMFCYYCCYTTLSLTDDTNNNPKSPTFKDLSKVYMYGKYYLCKKHYKKHHKQIKQDVLEQKEIKWDTEDNPTIPQDTHIEEEAIIEYVLNQNKPSVSLEDQQEPQEPIQSSNPLTLTKRHQKTLHKFKRRTKSRG
jgi:hypothetical protein